MLRLSMNRIGLSRRLITIPTAAGRPSPTHTIHQTLAITHIQKHSNPPLSLYNSPFFSSSSSSSFSSSSPSHSSRTRFPLLLSSADSNPSDVTRQYQLLKEANRLGEHAFVVNRVESGRYATNASCNFEYNRAIQAIRVAEQRLQQHQQQAANLQSQTYPTQSSSYSPYDPAFASSFAPPSFNPSAPGSAPNNPVIIREVAPKISWSESFYGAIPRIAIVLGLFLAYVFWKKRKGGTDSASEGGPSIFNPFGGTKDFLNREMTNVRFKDVKGCDEAKAELQEIVEFLKNPAKFERLGGKMTKGVLLTGQPGTGKTLLAKAVAGEAGVPFFSASGAEFDEMFIGVGAKRIRDLFAAARKQKRAIIFLDEIDAIGGNRDKIQGSHGRATINALLTEMDGFTENTGIVVIGATNLDRSLDPALVRPGRFDRTVAVSLPDAQGRLDILNLYASKMKLHPEVDLKLLSQTTSGMSGAELHNLLNTAAIRASAAGKSNIDHDEIEYAYDKILMGAERSFTQSAEVKANTAYHEAGHTIMLLNTPSAPELHKVTILPRGRALGAMFFLPLNEHRIMTRAQLLAHIDICMGGRVAEEFLSGKERITSGASNDLEQASANARAMVTQYGMGSTTGVFTLPDPGDGTNPAQIVAPETLKLIDEEVGRILKDSYSRAKNVIASHRVEWERLARALITHEVLDAKQVMQAVRGEPITQKIVHKFRPKDDATSGGATQPEPTSTDSPTDSPIGGRKPNPIVKA